MKHMEKKTQILIVVMFVVTLLLSWLVRFKIPYQESFAGYWTLGDVGVYISAALLGGPWAALISAVAFGLADIFAGQAIYAIGSLIIKAIMALLFAWYSKRGNTFLHIVKGIGICGGVMTVFYFLYNLIILGNYPAAAIGLPIHILQVIASGVITVPVLFLMGGKSYRQGDGFSAGKNGGFSSTSARRQLK